MDAEKQNDAAALEQKAYELRAAPEFYVGSTLGKIAQAIESLMCIQAKQLREQAENQQ